MLRRLHLLEPGERDHALLHPQLRLARLVVVADPHGHAGSLATQQAVDGTDAARWGGHSGTRHCAASGQRG